jgi:hypothetical protein
MIYYKVFKYYILDAEENPIDDYNENNEEDENNKELIYQEESGYQNVEKLFNDESDESAIYEIEFKIFDKQFKNVIFS